MWGIKPEVEKEWGNTFDKLVEYHNMPNEDLKETTKMIFSRRNNKNELRKNNEILEDSFNLVPSICIMKTFPFLLWSFSNRVILMHTLQFILYVVVTVKQAYDCF